MRLSASFWFLCLGVCGAARADTPPVAAARPAAIVMLPAGFGNVHLGMTMGELLAARHNLVSLDLFETAPPVTALTLNRELLEQNPAGPVFQTATYRVRHGHLAALVVSGQVSLADLQRVRQALTSEALSLYGAPDSIRTAQRDQEDGTVNSAVLTWKVGGTSVALLYPTNLDEGKVKSGSVEELFDTASPELASDFQVPKISREQENKIWEPVLAQVERDLPGQSQKVGRIFAAPLVVPPPPQASPVATGQPQPPKSKKSKASRRTSGT